MIKKEKETDNQGFTLYNKIRDFKIIKDKSLNVAITKLATIKNIVYGWIINEEKVKIIFKNKLLV